MYLLLHVLFLFRLTILSAWTTADEEAEDAQLWGDNWDDEDANLDDFSHQLRAELNKNKPKGTHCI